MTKKQLFTIISLIGLAVASRFLPHPPNFAPITAIALFGGVWFADKRLAFLIPIGIMLLSDLFLGFHSTMPFVYISFMLMVGVGFWLKKHYKPANLLISAIGGSMLFYVVTNFGVWMMGSFYPPTISGLVSCYVAAIPFFHYTLLGDLVYTATLFGAFEIARSSYLTPLKR